MKNVFVFHGTGGYPQENWFPWVRQQVESMGCPCIVPQFPTPEGQSVQAWWEVLQPHIGQIGPETVIIGHSLGGLFLLRLLEQLETQIEAAFFVAAPVGVEPIKNGEADKRFAEGYAFHWEKIKTKAREFSVFQSDNDPFVPLGNGTFLANKLGVELTFIPNAGHFNTAAGYTEFPALWEKVEAKLLSPISSTSRRAR